MPNDNLITIEASTRPQKLDPNLQVDPNVLFNDARFENPDKELLKKILSSGEYMDNAGIKWQVTSEQDAAELEKFNGMLKRNSKGSSTKNNSSNIECLCFSFYYLRQKNAADFSVYMRFESTDPYGSAYDYFSRNTFTITFSYKHDLRTRITSMHGKPEDVSKYTKDVARKL